MKKILLVVMALCLFVITASADIGLPGTVDSTVKGVSVDNALACFANDLGSESKNLYTLWAGLNEKRSAGTLTEKEAGDYDNKLGYNQEQLVKLFPWIENEIAWGGICFNIMGGIKGTVVLLDGLDYLVDYCAPSYKCIRVIQKSDGFEKQ